MAWGEWGGGSGKRPDDPQAGTKVVVDFESLVGGGRGSADDWELDDTQRGA